MKSKHIGLLFGILALTTGYAASAPRAEAQLPSWNDGPAKTAVVGFVERVTREGGPEYVAPAKRIAVFDNDGTLWTEQPIYIQLAFAFDRIKALVNEHPEWKEKQPFKAVLENDIDALAKSGKRGLIEW